MTRIKKIYWGGENDIYLFMYYAFYIIEYMLFHSFF